MASSANSSYIASRGGHPEAEESKETTYVFASQGAMEYLDSAADSAVDEDSR